MKLPGVYPILLEASICPWFCFPSASFLGSSPPSIAVIEMDTVWLRPQGRWSPIGISIPLGLLTGTVSHTHLIPA